MLGMIIGAAATTLLISVQTGQPTTDAQHWRRLDAWVERGGDPNRLQEDVVTSCGQIMIAAAGVPKAAVREYVRANREDLDLRVHFCVQLTVHRVHKQPGIEDSLTIDLLCESKDEVFLKLCRRAGLIK